MVTNKEVEYISEQLKSNINLLLSLGFNKISLNDYYTSTMKIIDDIKEQKDDL